MHQLRWLLPLAFAVFPGCKLFDHKKHSPQSTSAPSSAPGSGSSAAASRDVSYAIQLSLGTTAPTAAATSYEDVRELLANRCVSCHGATATLDLSAFPFKGRFATPAETVEGILTRVQDPARPMPPAPNAALAAAEIQNLKDWQAAGLKVKPDADVTPTAVPFADTITLHLKARAAHAAADIDASFPWNGSGQFTGALRLPLLDTVNVRLSLLGEDGAELANKTYEDLAVAAEGDFRFTLSLPAAADAIRAHVVDKTPPVLGAEAVVTASEIDETGVTLNWGRASDQFSAAGALTYAVFVADDAAAVDSAAHAVANGRKALDFAKDLAGGRIDGLARGHTYYFAVVVKDEAGNMTLYKVLTQATAADKVPPTVPTPALRASNVTEARATLAWSAAQDNLSAADKLTYQVFFAAADQLNSPADIAASGTLVGVSKPGVASLNVTGLVPATAYFFNVLAVDEHDNKAAYKTLRLVTPAESGARTQLDHARQCAARLGVVKPFSCFDGQLLPIEVDQAAIPPNLTPQQASRYHFGRNDAQTGAQQTCDKPPLLGLGAYGHCIPYARVGRVKTYRPDGAENTDVDGVFTCRRYVPRLGQQQWQGAAYDGASYPGFEDIAMILHDRVSGETCFFQMLDPLARPKDGRRIPPPTEEALPAGSPAYAVKAKDFWLNAADTAAKKCGRCHDSDPWVHSPYIEQARDAAGKPLVPAGGVGAPGSSKYSIIGSRGFYQWQKSQAVGSTNTADTNGKSCTSCHAIGNLNTCTSWLRQSAGFDEGPNLSPTGRTNFLYRHWMPPADQGVRDAATWASSGFQRAAEHLADCCANAKAPGCTFTPIMTLPPPYAEL